ncbi:ribonuclease HII [Janibacter alittae]|uniref:Ribonuclease HII n=1 Tax=Janibacter alittae TaxID=3115209 RepID=A0ABZ2MKL6_9MICO
MTRPGAPRSSRPSLRLERELQRAGHRVIAGMDEVGRGALAGPVSVGVVVIDETSPSAPTGVKDSKLLTAAARERMVPRLIRWARAHSVGHAMPGEIDEIGIIAALRLAGTRALADLDLVPDLVLLDGNHDWLTDPEQVGLLAELAGPVVPPVRTVVKGDMRCSSVAGASVLAKVERDGMMAELDREHPHYGWAGNKGYSAGVHMDALSVHGACGHHRRSWSLPGLCPGDSAVVDDEADVVARSVGDLVSEGRPQ